MKITEKNIVALAQRASAKINQYRLTHPFATNRQFEADIANIISAELRKSLAVELQNHET